MDPVGVDPPPPASFAADDPIEDSRIEVRSRYRWRISITPQTAIGRRFWLIFLASTVTHVGYSASTPLLPRYLRDVFDGDPATVGAVVAATPIVSLVVQPLVGVAADRLGYRRLSLVGSVVAATGMFLTVLATSVPAVGASRVVFGLGEAAALTGLMAWVIAVASPTGRGRALSMFGVSVWIGIAVGPVIGETIYQSRGFRTVWTVCSILLLIAVASILLSPTPDRDRPVDADDSPPSRIPVGWGVVMRAITRPAIVAASVWGAQGVMLAFLVLHLESRGMRTDGVTGAAAVFTVFAITVIAARVLLGSLPDRLGAIRSARYSLIALTTGLLVLTIARSFLVASVGAVVLGVAFAPLYPALVILAVQDLDPSRRATGLGAFNSFTSLGMAIGSFAGGLFAGWWGEWSAFAAAAAAQTLALLVIAPRRRA